MKIKILPILILLFTFFFVDVNIGIVPLGSKQIPKITTSASDSYIPLKIGQMDIPSPTRYIINRNEIECLAKNIYFEAAVESTAGKVAVAQVTINRVMSKSYPNTICEVVYEGSHFASGHPKRDMCQFSWYCDGKRDTVPPGNLWNESQRIAKEMIKRHLTAQLLDITDGATHYHASWMESYPRWSNERKKMTHIDQHIFYK